jgi:hypothetical protein
MVGIELRAGCAEIQRANGSQNAHRRADNPKTMDVFATSAIR